MKSSSSLDVSDRSSPFSNFLDDIAGERVCQGERVCHSVVLFETFQVCRRAESGPVHILGAHRTSPCEVMVYTLVAATERHMAFERQSTERDRAF